MVEPKRRRKAPRVETKPTVSVCKTVSPDPSMLNTKPAPRAAAHTNGGASEATTDEKRSPKKRNRNKVRLQKSRLLAVESNLRLLMERGLTAKKSDAAILATAPRMLLRPVTMELYKSLSPVEKANFRRGCRQVVDGKAKIDKDKLKKVIHDKEEHRLAILKEFVLRRRDQREQVKIDAVTLATDQSTPGALIRLGSIPRRRAQLGLDGKTRVFAYAAKVEGLENDLRRKKKRSAAISDDGNMSLSDAVTKATNNEDTLNGQRADIGAIPMPKVSCKIKNPEKADENMKIVMSELKPTHMFFLEKCKLSIGDKKKAVIKRRCEGEGFLVEVEGKICALHITQLFAKLDDFAQPMEWFEEGQEISVFIRDVVEMDRCPYLTRVKGLSGNLVVSTTLLPPDQWIIKVAVDSFTAFTCPASSPQSTTDKMELTISPTVVGRMPYQLFDESVLRLAPQMKIGTAINVRAYRLERTLSKFNDFTGSRLLKEECFGVPQRGQVIPVVRINISKHLLPCKSRFTGWKVMLPLTEAHDNLDELDRSANLIPTLAIVMAVNEKKKTAIISTRPSRLRSAIKGTPLCDLIPKQTNLPKMSDAGVMNVRLLHGKKDAIVRGFLVKRFTTSDKQQVLPRIFLGMDYLWPIWGHFGDTSTLKESRLGHYLRRLPSLSVIQVRLLENDFTTKTGVKVALVDHDEVQERVYTQESGQNTQLDPLQHEASCNNREEISKAEVRLDEDSLTQKGGQYACFGEEASALASDDDEEGFDWDYDAQPNLTQLAKEVVSATKKDGDSSSSEDSDHDDKNTKRDIPGAKRTKADREDERRRKEIQMREQENKRTRRAQGHLASHEEIPQTAEEFEREVMASPNDSSLWLRLMALHLEQLEVDRARQVAKRALKTIHGSEQDKLNIWLAVLNLENLYGSQESLETAFQEALKHNEPLKVYSHLAKIFASSHKTDQARGTFQTMLKKFKPHKEVWMEFGSWLFEIGELQEARQLLKRSFASIPEREHVGVIQRFAALEFAHGEQEVGEGLMDNLLISYPKRLDLWCVYIDMLVKIGDFDAVRHKFEKLLTAKLPTRKMKSVFKKWLAFEQKHGTPDDVEKVKQKVIAYIDMDSGNTRE